MAKVTVNGEVFAWDPAHKPMSEALALENGLKCNYAQWEADLQAGSARALAAFIWLLWRRDGRDVTLEAILAGDVEIDLAGLSIDDDGDEAEAGPTALIPAASNTTGSNISVSSPKSSTSARGKSAS